MVRVSPDTVKPVHFSPLLFNWIVASLHEMCVLLLPKCD